jgi:hypothetical protein
VLHKHTKKMGIGDSQVDGRAALADESGMVRVRRKMASLTWSVDACSRSTFAP